MTEKRVYITDKAVFITDDKNLTPRGRLIIPGVNEKQNMIFPRYTPDIIPEGTYVHESQTGVTTREIRGFDANTYHEVRKVATLSEEEYKMLVELHDKKGCVGQLLSLAGIESKFENTVVRYIKKRSA